MLHVLGALVHLLVEVTYYWYSQFKTYLLLPKISEVDELKIALRRASTYDEWVSIAHLLDSNQGNDLWRQNPVSAKYDYKLISMRMKQLVKARQTGNSAELVSLLRSGLLRNLGSIANSELYNRSYYGTKLLIEEYITEVILCLEYLASSESDDHFKSPQAKLDFLHDTRQSFGRSALVLHGGSLFGICHVGVVKGLFLQGLLPRIVSGTTVGALVAALVCVFGDDELLEVLDSLEESLPAVDVPKKSKIDGMITGEYPAELVSLAAYVKDLLGDMTFEQAYLKTDRVLNITVTSDRPTHVPALLNYLTTPNVTIWSAVNASIGTGVLSDDVTLMAKDHKGILRPSVQGSVKFTPANKAIYTERESPYTKQAELFNVNNFTVSLARPYLAPLFAGEQTYRGYGGWRPKLSRVFKLELQHRLRQIAKIGMLPDLVHRVLLDERVPGGEDVTVVPELDSFVKDFVLSDGDEGADYYLCMGEKSVWPFVSIIWARCAIEFVLDDLYTRARKSTL